VIRQITNARVGSGLDLPEGRLALAAVKEFGARPFDEVTVGELAAAAKVITGALYHHFGSKLGLYSVVREDVGRRLLDRMEGALAATGPESDHSAAVTSALLVGLDFAVREDFLRILGDPPAGTEPDGWPRCSARTPSLRHRFSAGYSRRPGVAH
jgi:AcrR family transcriptional regulator